MPAKQIIPNGTTFSYAYADSCPTWTVMHHRGGDAYDCEVVDDMDWKGAKKVFGGEEIRAQIAYDKALASMTDEADAWWEARAIGEVVHYHNGFDQYVRGVIVVDGGQKKMRAIALVGDWKSYDLPRRRPNGEIEYGYHARGVIEGNLSRPHASNMFEYPSYSRRRGEVAPATLEPISLDLPPLDSEAERQARLEKLRESVREAAGADTTEQMFAELRLILSKAEAIQKEAA